MMRQHVAGPTVLNGLGGIPEAVRRGVEFVEERDVMTPRQLCNGALHNWGHDWNAWCNGRLHNWGRSLDALCKGALHH